jgi:hypothetical protein
MLRVDLIPVLVGALIAIAGGVIFRVVEARQQRHHWFRDQLRMGAEQFLAHATQFLRVTADRALSHDIATFDAAMTANMERDEALAIDISRLELIAPQTVCTTADGVMKKLNEAFSEANKIRPEGRGPERQAQEDKAAAASRAAYAEIDSFVQVAKLSLRRPWRE